jgi:hypothetical protein
MNGEIKWRKCTILLQPKGKSQHHRLHFRLFHLWAQWIFLMIILTIFQTHRRLFPVSGDSTRFENFALYWNGRVRGLEYTQPFLFEPHRSKIKIISSEISLFISGIIMTSWKTDVISASIGHPNSSHTSQRPGTHVKLCSLLIKKNYIR